LARGDGIRCDGRLARDDVIWRIAELTRRAAVGRGAWAHIAAQRGANELRAAPLALREARALADALQARFALLEHEAGPHAEHEDPHKNRREDDGLAEREVAQSLVCGLREAAEEDALHDPEHVERAEHDPRSSKRCPQAVASERAEQHEEL